MTNTSARSQQSSMQSPADSVLYLNKHLYQYLNSWWDTVRNRLKMPRRQYMKAALRAMTVYPDDGTLS
jgi:hypothetical protein